MRRIKSLLARIALWILGRGICACAVADSRVQAEVRSWPEGVRVAMRAEPAGPAMLLEKRDGFLRFPGVRPVERADLMIEFKHLNAALPVLLGAQGVTRAFAEHRTVVRGDLTFAMSVVRMMLVVEAYLFPRLVTRRIMQRVPHQEVSRARVYLSTFLAADGA